MIETPLTFLAILLFIASLLVFAQDKLKLKLFEYLPAIVLLYLSIVLLSSLGLWQKNSEITALYKTLKNILLPAMIFLLLLSANIKEIAKLGSKMLFTFVLTVLSIMAGFIVMFTLMHGLFETEAWRAFAALSGSWMGGTANMLAIQGALDVSEASMGYVLLIDSIDYALWVMLLLLLVPFAKKVNAWTGANTKNIDAIEKNLSKQNQNSNMDFASLFLLLTLSLVVSTLSTTLSLHLPTTNFLTQSTWVVLFATLFGIIGSLTPLGKLSGSMTLGNIMLYALIALIASRVSLHELTQAPLYIVAGFVILAVHALLMVLFAKLFKLDLFSIGVASLANIGGIASAPILASAYSKALIPIGVLMAMLGYIVGTFGGLLVGKILKMLS